MSLQIHQCISEDAGHTLGIIKLGTTFKAPYWLCGKLTACAWNTNASGKTIVGGQQKIKIFGSRRWPPGSGVLTCSYAKNLGTVPLFMSHLSTVKENA